MTALQSILFEEISEAGWISFERFMEAALYHPLHGYYETPREVGRRGDFYTSVSVGGLFAELLAREFASWVREAGLKKPLTWVECGAHDGQFSSDFCSLLSHAEPELWSRFTYQIIEPSLFRRSRQQARLAEFGAKCLWFGNLDEFSARGVVGTLFSNELLDAMPVTRVGWNAKEKRWFEWGVGLDQCAFCWVRGPTGASAELAVQQALGRICGDASAGGVGPLLEVLPDGFTVDLCPAAGAWWEKAASKLANGRLMTFDYGLSTPELFSPARASGTLRGYRGHRLEGSVLDRPGEQDLTAHVDFDALAAAGSRSGLSTQARMPQGQYLTRLVAGMHSRDAARIRQFQTLTHPSHLGFSHSVLVQHRAK